MKRLIFILFVACSAISFGQLSAVKGKTTYPFWINLPADSILQNSPPILIFLHGKSLSGTDMSRVRKYGVIHEIDKGRTFPAIVIAPQVASGSWQPDKIIEVLDYVQKKYRTNEQRVYVIGMSLGGYGTMHFAGAYPERVTAAVALCGGGNQKDACRLSTIPLWIQHGTADKAVSVNESRKMVEAIKKCDGGKKLIYTEIKGADHGAPEKVFRTDEIYNWMFQFVKI